MPTWDTGNLKVNVEQMLSPREFRPGNSCVIGTVSEERPIAGEDMCLVTAFKIASLCLKYEGGVFCFVLF